MTDTRPLRTLTHGQVEALPEPERSRIRAQILREVLGAMQARDERYLQGDYAGVGSRQACAWGR